MLLSAFIITTFVIALGCVVLGIRKRPRRRRRS